VSEGKVCVVTGATSGIGLETVKLLAAHGSHVIGIGRNGARCAAARENILAGNPGASVWFETADLSSLEQVRDVARRIGSMVGHLNVLVNNAGTFTFTRKRSADGFELQLAVNWLAGFSLTGLLLPLLAAAPGARVVTVSSGSHFAGRIHWKDLQLTRGYNGLKAYDQSKLATVLFTRELARRLGRGSTIDAYAVDPGLVRTDIGAKGGSALVQMIWRLRTRKGISARAAARSVYYCAMAEDADGQSGLYWKECASLPPSPRAVDGLDALKLWEMGEQLSGTVYPWSAAGP
jgi:retinol dehydrogenase-12